MKLKITIAGPVKSGKSTVAYLVKRALEDAGFTTTVTDLDTISEFMEQTTLRKAIALSEKGLHIDLEVVQSNRQL